MADQSQKVNGQPEMFEVMANLGQCSEETCAQVITEIADMALRYNINAVIEMGKWEE